MALHKSVDYRLVQCRSDGYTLCTGMCKEGDGIWYEGMVRERFGEEADEFPVGGRRELELCELFCSFGVRWCGKKSIDSVAEGVFL